MDHVRTFFYKVGERRFFTAAFLILLLAGVLTATDTVTNTSQKAHAGNCFVDSQGWTLRGGSVPLTIGTASFGATICVDNGQISGVSPFLNGGTEGAGTPAGFDFDNQGAWVVRQSGTYVEVQGQSKVKECLPGLRNVVCSMTDTERYTLRYSTVYGPYVPGTEPGIFVSSQSCSVFGGCYPGVTFIPR